MRACDIPRPPTRLERLRRFAPRILPFLTWWPLVNRRTVRADLWAGLTGAVIVLPQGVAFAAIAGLPPEYGLYAAMVPVIVAALFGSSFHLISGRPRPSPWWSTPMSPSWPLRAARISSGSCWPSPCWPAASNSPWAWPGLAA